MSPRTMSAPPVCEAIHQSAIVQHGACTSPSLLAKPDRDAIPGDTDRGLGGMPPLRPAVSACPLTIPHPAIVCNRGNEKDRSRSSREGSGPGAGGGTRTHTVSPPTDFESLLAPFFARRSVALRSLEAWIFNGFRHFNRFPRGSRTHGKIDLREELGKNCFPIITSCQ